MFAYIKGVLSEKADKYVVVENAGIGYKIFMTDTAIANIGEINESVKVYTYYYVREDVISLYGFLSNEELKMFELLLGVSGIGAKSAISMLSSITPSSFALAVISNDIKKLTKIPGVGPKGAQRIVLELKDKLKTTQAISDAHEVKEEKKVSENQAEAMEALQILGYNKKEIEKVFEKIEDINLSTEVIIKNALKFLS